MTLKKIFNMGLVNDDTEICIRPSAGFIVLARGNWYQDDILKYLDKEIESFVWQDDNNFYVDLR